MLSSSELGLVARMEIIESGGADGSVCTFGYTITYLRVLETQARLLGAYLLGKVSEYVPFMTR